VRKKNPQNNHYDFDSHRFGVDKSRGCPGCVTVDYSQYNIKPTAAIRMASFMRNSFFMMGIPQTVLDSRILKCETRSS
jgi:hypothetical protein